MHERSDNSLMWLVLAGIGAYLFFKSQAQTIPAVNVGGVMIPVPGVLAAPPVKPTYPAGTGMEWQLSPSWMALPPGQQWVQVPVGTIQM